MVRNPRKKIRLLAGVLSIAVVFWAGVTDSWGQGQVIRRQVRAIQAKKTGTPASADENVENVFLPANRDMLKKLSEARQLLTERRFSEAVRNLGAILDWPEDFLFQPDKRSPGYRSLKTEAQRLIGQMPREGREAYELQYGACARRMLDEALESGNPARLAEVSRRFFHTRSGYQATFLLAEDHLAHGRSLAGALTLQRLQEMGSAAEEFEPNLSLTVAACWLQAGMAEKAKETLVALRKRQPNLHVAVGGRDVPLFTDDAKAVEWLESLMGSRPPDGARPRTIGRCFGVMRFGTHCPAAARRC